VVRPPLIVGAIALAGLACRDKAPARPDASPDSLKVDVSTPLTLAIAVTGCASYDPAAVISSGVAECSIGYWCHSTGQPPATSVSRDCSAHGKCTTWS